jgi:hypothetical protein
VIGPPVYLPSSGNQLNETLKPLFDIFSGATKTIGPPIGSGGFVDVRDVAFLHIWAFEYSDQADGERFCACQGFGPLQAVADILKREYKGTSIGEKIPLGEPCDEPCKCSCLNLEFKIKKEGSYHYNYKKGLRPQLRYTQLGRT